MKIVIEIIMNKSKKMKNIILILDEVHQLNKQKQDYLLPHLEDNIITMIGCTTSNPYHSINPAIRSRCHLFELYPLTAEQIKEVIDHTLDNKTSGFGELDRKSTRLNSSHVAISYAVFCLKHK